MDIDMTDNFNIVEARSVDVNAFATGNNIPEVVKNALDGHIVTFGRVGSRETCNPAPVDTDEDWLILVKGGCADIADKLHRAGFKEEGDPDFYEGLEEGGFISWRLGDLNIIVTHNFEFYNKFLTATALAKHFNLLKKQDRIMLFQGVLYGRHPNHVKLMGSYHKRFANEQLDVA